jgi:biotin carboxyl carrier protein
VLEDGRNVHVAADVAPDPVASAHDHGPGGAGAARIAAPMPGRILAVRVTVGATVAAGDVLVVLEAMKMEHPVTAPDDAVVATVTCREGDQVTVGAVLVELRPAP